MDENLLVYYNNQWKRYTTSSTFVNNLFRYLNRYWVKRTAEEGKKDIYEIYTVRHPPSCSFPLRLRS